MARRSTCKAADLSRVLPFDSTSTLSSHIARMLVLYEDLRIELNGVSAEHIEILDFTDERYRSQYFLRRSVGTLWEFAEAFRLLDALLEFGRIKSAFDDASRDRWNRTVIFFRTFEPKLKKIRNDVGGHFGAAAAYYAVEHFTSRNVGNIEAYEEIRIGKKAGHGFKLRCAGEIAAVPFARHLPGDNTSAQMRYLFRRLLVAYRRAIWSVDALVKFELWPKFGR